jgi:hypothetical protein
MVYQYFILSGKYYAAQDANIINGFIGALIILLGYALLQRTRPVWLAAILQRVYVCLLLAADVILLIAIMLIKGKQ